MKRAGPLSVSVLEDFMQPPGSPLRFKALVIAGGRPVAWSHCATRPEALREAQARAMELGALEGDDVAGVVERP